MMHSSTHTRETLLSRDDEDPGAFFVSGSSDGLSDNIHDRLRCGSLSENLQERLRTKDGSLSDNLHERLRTRDNSSSNGGHRRLQRQHSASSLESVEATKRWRVIGLVLFLLGVGSIIAGYMLFCDGMECTNKFVSTAQQSTNGTSVETASPSPSQDPSATSSSSNVTSDGSSPASSTEPQAFVCFDNQQSLISAVRANYSDVGAWPYTTYGPLSDWCFDPSLTSFGMVFKGTVFSEDISGWDVQHVQDFNDMFYGSTFNQDISNWNVGSATSMQGMFHDSGFNQDLSRWNVSNVQDFGLMFRHSSFNQDIGMWNVSSGTNMLQMFSGSSFNQDIGQWSVSSATDVRQMFAGSSFNQDISGWKLSQVESFDGMFAVSSFNQDIGHWNVSAATSMSDMFAGTPFNQDLTDWDVSRVQSFAQMFYNSSFNQDISTWNIESATDVHYMLYAANSFEQNLCPWADYIQENMTVNEFLQSAGCPDKSDPSLSADNVGALCNTCDTAGETSAPSEPPTSLPPSTLVPSTEAPSSNPTNGPVIPSCFPDRSTLDNALVLDYTDATTFPHTTYGPISEWCFEPTLTDFSSLFKGSRFNEDISAWDVSNVTNFDSMFSGSSFNQNINKWNVGSATSMAKMFLGAPFNQELSDWNVSQVQGFNGMFARSLFNQDISAWNVESATTLEKMFQFAQRFDHNLCAWNDHLQGSIQVYSMFTSSGCPEPSLALSGEHLESLCHSCSSPETTEAPSEVRAAALPTVESNSTVYLQYNGADFKWLSGGRSIGQHSVDTLDFYEPDDQTEEEPEGTYQWKIYAETAEEEDCIAYGQYVVLEVHHANDSLTRYLAGGQGRDNAHVKTEDPAVEEGEEQSYLWIVRSVPGDGTIDFGSDPKFSECIHYSDTVYLQNANVESRWLGGGEEDSEAVSTRDIWEEPEQYIQFQWVLTQEVGDGYRQTS